MGVEKAVKEIALADHIIYVTMPLLNDKQLFINAAKHLTSGVNTLIKEYMKNKTPTMNEELMINEFLTMKEFKEYESMIKNLNNFNKQAIKSGIKLKRNNKVIIISPDYKAVTISGSELKEYIIKAKKLLKELKVKQ